MGRYKRARKSRIDDPRIPCYGSRLTGPRLNLVNEDNCKQ